MSYCHKLFGRQVRFGSLFGQRTSGLINGLQPEAERAVVNPNTAPRANLRPLLAQQRASPNENRSKGKEA